MQVKNTSYWRYLFYAGASSIVILIASFIYAWAAPMLYNKEYSWTKSKLKMIKDCDLAPVAFLGDSRVVAGIKPKNLPFDAVNLGVPGGGPIDSYFLLRKILACPNHPTTVVLSFTAYHFNETDAFFWGGPVMFGSIDISDLPSLLRTSYFIGDYWSIFRHGVPRTIKSALASPALTMKSLLDGHPMKTLDENRAVEREIILARGYKFFGYHPSPLGDEVKMKSFRVRPIIDKYFDMMMQLFEANNIRVLFVEFPINQDTAQSSDLEVLAKLSDYLRPYQIKYPAFDVVNALPIVWKNDLFGDLQGHLNVEGANLFTSIVASCVANNSPSVKAQSLQRCIE